MLEEFCGRLQFSGYPPRVAARILRNGIINFENRKAKAMKGTLKLHRPEDEGKLERRFTKITGKSNWFRMPGKSKDDCSRNGGAKKDSCAKTGGWMSTSKPKPERKMYERKEEIRRKEIRIAAPLFVPATRDGILAIRMKLEEEKLGNLVGWKFKIVERGGRTIRDLLTQSNPFEKEKCGRERCISCSMGAKPQNCRKRSLLYETYCTACMDGEIPLARYVGETARSANERFGEHWEDAQKKRKDSHIYKHWQNKHGGEETTFKFKIISFHLSPLDRQIAEAVRIARTGGERILNSKGEFNRCELPRIVTVDTREAPTLGDTPPTTVDQETVTVEVETEEPQEMSK